MTNTNKPEVSEMPLDVIKLAQRCGASQLLYLSGDSVPSYTLVGNTQLQAFANAILEEAAKRFNQPHVEYFGTEIQDEIRGMKG